ncbi:TetR/AcrR family transcriptional regulator [Kribbella sandramycini]|uniref:AcrR family transcriptional regulator n=1 Tax=Kribbella sandramycini TaxID=60450 RepID=A0A7Y4L3H7_9ACTN|nr:ScbR family autoregulator-binding transcription factor [Kribbella sandramycini]MBB6566566.1 AcrR family transcriptional regulator [Kribbella sandramycini]NOL42777.1 TetR/AcrR family transcriptional regulator [Kribbella sandramycini]
MAGRAVKQARAERTRATVLEAAAEVFAELGFSGASVMKIADRAGVTLGGVYFHFRSKEELARAIVAGQPDFVVPPKASTGLQRAIDVTLVWARALAESPMLRAGARLVWEQDRFMGTVENSHEQWTVIVAADLQTAQDEGELRADVDVQAVARLVVNACTGAQMHSYVETAHKDLPDRVEEIWRCLLPALKN